MDNVSIYLNFAGKTEQAFTFYKAVFNTEFLMVMRFKDFPDMPGMEEFSEEDRNKIGHIAIPIGKNTILMGTDSLECLGQQLQQGNNMYIVLNPESLTECERLWNALTEGGKTEMPLAETFWAERYGSFTDKFGTPWMISFEGNKAQQQ